MEFKDLKGQNRPNEEHTPDPIDLRFAGVFHAQKRRSVEQLFEKFLDGSCVQEKLIMESVLLKWTELEAYDAEAIVPAMVSALGIVDENGKPGPDWAPLLKGPGAPPSSSHGHKHTEEPGQSGPVLLAA